MKQWLFEMLCRIGSVRKIPTPTEGAFEAAAELNKMRLFIRNNGLLDCTDDIPMDVVKKYGMSHYFHVWRVLYKQSEQIKTEIVK